MSLQESPKVMGIININNESFFEKSRCTNSNLIIDRIEQMFSVGASIIDIGGCSTRPGSTPVSMEQEWEYLKAPLQELSKHITQNPNSFLAQNGTRNSISIDTFHSEIVKRVYDIIGEFIVNDISAGEDDKQMLKCVGELNLPYIAMHKRGTSSTMQQMCDYPNGVVNEIIEYFSKFHHKAGENGIEEYIIDPGFGFAKTIEQNFALLNGLGEIKKELTKQCKKEPKILIGLSRKGMIWKTLNITPDESLHGTVALNLQALLQGGDIIRVHDVKEGFHCVKLWEKLYLCPQILK